MPLLATTSRLALALKGIDGSKFSKKKTFTTIPWTEFKMLSQKRQTISSDSTHELVKHHFDGYLEKIYLETSGVPAKEAKDESIAKEKPIVS